MPAVKVFARTSEINVNFVSNKFDSCTQIRHAATHGRRMAYYKTDQPSQIPTFAKSTRQTLVLSVGSRFTL